MSKKQTAVEWLVENLKDSGIPFLTEEIEFIKQALQMEKNQMEEIWNTAHQAGRFEGKGIAEENWQTFEQIYTIIYGK